ncbi:hypothetical protein [Pseudidiomarina aestuarii]|uniref:hypothetical protein n=1 Tax=Pseudidiomarina aestuarii TaxID=624146 RepID=UPI003A97EA84
MKNIISLTIVLLLAGCGGSSSESVIDNSVGSSQPTPPEEIVEGGTRGTPADLSLSIKNKIATDSVNNYFKINLDMGDRLYIYSVLDLPLSGRWLEQCVYASSNADLGINIDGKANACGYSLAYTAEAAESITVHFDFPDGHSGYAYADIVKTNQRIAGAYTGKGSKPSTPTLVKLNERHAISRESFYNFYAIEGNKSQTIVMTSYLDDSIGERLEAWCPTMYRGFSATRSGRAYGFSLNEEDYSCSRVAEFTFPEDGTYYLHARYFDHYDPVAPIGGYFIVEQKQ